ncbi:MAG: hypothetical protein JNJ61_02515 [Anaerolineae bacterium]|nr:hypothetical protein [Anaerolineae bacterium]
MFSQHGQRAYRRMQVGSRVTITLSSQHVLMAAWRIEVNYSNVATEAVRGIGAHWCNCRLA